MTEEEKINGENNYSASNIQVLEGLEAVRKRPAMYIGDISIKGLHHLVYEVVDNSIDEALAGYCDHIEVTINEDNSITVQDNGRGIPVDFHEKEQKSALEVVMTVLHAGGKFDKGSYKVSGGLHGVGVSCVNALSTHMTTQVFRNGKIYQQEYECGHPLYSVKEVGITEITGTRQQFWPDDTIFTETVYNYDILATRMRELAYLNAGIKITLTDLRVKEEDGNYKQEIFYSVEGLKEFVRYIDSSREHSGERCHLHQHRETGHTGGSGHHVQHFLQREHPLLRKQYQYHRRRYPLGRFPSCAYPYVEEIRRRQQDAGKGQSRDFG